MGGRTLVTQFRKDGMVWVWGKWERVGKERLEKFGRSGWEELRGMGRVLSYLLRNSIRRFLRADFIRRGSRAVCHFDGVGVGGCLCGCEAELF